ncbi:hypothetical protein JCM19238_1700 [Vibrio ponticus]|nr:hypothetical protein JCM19238_1700 [Vibrio ponticus]
MTKFYLALTVLGILLPYGAFLPWLLTHGVDISLLYQQATVNPISIGAWLDVVVAVVALLGFIWIDGQRQNIKYRSVAVIGTLTVGVSCGLPLYLYLRERQSQVAN